MSKLQDIRNLVQEHAVLVSSSPGNWMDYMDTASRLYRYSFSDQLLIHAQRPDATACASLELWNEKMLLRSRISQQQPLDTLICLLTLGNLFT